jgi:hypothetical protein
MWRFGVSCEGVFTTETQRGAAATETRNISRKDAKVKTKNFRTWRLGDLARVNLRVVGLWVAGKFAQAAQTVRDNNTVFAEGFFKMTSSFDFLRALSASAVSHTEA